MKSTARIAFCGLLGSLAVICLLLTVFPLGTYALPAMASLFFVPVVIECGKRWALALYAAVSLLALLIAPDIEAKLLFVFFFGYYPVLKSWCEQQNRVVEWLCKAVVFNGAVVLAYVLLSAVGFSMEVFAFSETSWPLSVVLAGFLLLGNLVFFLYDLGISRMLPLYFLRLQPLVKRLFK